MIVIAPAFSMIRFGVESRGTFIFGAIAVPALIIAVIQCLWPKAGPALGKWITKHAKRLAPWPIGSSDIDRDVEAQTASAV